MKKLRTFKSLSAVAVVCFTFIFSLFVSCEIGLGAAVDTQSPQLSVDSPKVDTVIRDKFAIKGKWEDDGSVKNISVVLDRTDGFGKQIKLKGSWVTDETESGREIGKGHWYVVVDPDDIDSKHNKLVDGTYQATISITDNGNHVTKQSTTFTVDNTAPLLILKKPNSTPAAQGEEEKTLSVYGQTLYLEGSIADLTKQTWIQMDFYSDVNCGQESYLYSVETDSIAPTDVNQNNTKFAVYEEIVEEDGTKKLVDNDYSKIYNSDVKIGAVPVYAKLTIYDTAETIPLTAEEMGLKEDSEDAEEIKAAQLTGTPSQKGYVKGNKTQEFFISSDLARDLTKSEKNGGYGFAPIEMYNILNGTEDLKDESRSAGEKQKLTREELITLLASKSKKESVFSINPDNNPYFTISGLKTLSGSPRDFAASDGGYFIKNGSQTLEISVFMGSDSYELDADSGDFYAYLLEFTFDEAGHLKYDDKEENRIKLYSKYKEEGTGADKKSLYKIGGKEGHKTTTGAYVFSVPITKKLNTNTDEGSIEYDKLEGAKLVYGHNYLIRVNGKDVEGNPIDNESNKYGFRFSPSGAAPVVNITEPEKSIVYLKKGDALHIQGSVSSEESGLIVSFYKDTDAEPLHTIPLAEPDDNSKSPFEWTVPADTFDQNNSINYSLTIKVAGQESSSSPVVRTVCYDVEGPKIEIDREIPAVQSNGTQENCINGNFTLTGIITDDFDIFDSESAVYKVIQNGQETVLENTSLQKSKFSIPLDTRVLNDKQPATIVIKANDRAGNSTEISKEYYIDQDTDKPIISNNDKKKVNFDENNYSAITELNEYGYYYNKFQASSTLTVLADDDDNNETPERVEITLVLQDTTQETPVDSSEPDAIISSEPFEKQKVIQYTLPDSIGVYHATIKAYDIYYDECPAEEKQYHYSEKNFYLRVTGSGPKVDLEAPEFISTKNSDVNVNLKFVIANDGNGPYSLKMKRGNENFVELFRNKPSPIEYDGLTYTKGSLDTTKIIFSIEDSKGNYPTEVEYIPQFDNESPTIEFDSNGTPSSDENHWGDTDGDTFYFKGTVNDTAGSDPENPSGISKVSKVQILFKDGEVLTNSLTDNENWVDANSTPSTWNKLVSWNDSEEEKIKSIFYNVQNKAIEGKKTVFVKAIDKAGNESLIQSKVFVFNRAAPEVEEIIGAQYTNKSGIPLTIKIKDSNSDKPLVSLYRGDVKDENKLNVTIQVEPAQNNQNANGLFEYTANIVFPTVTPQEGDAYIPEGTYNVVVTGKDEYGRTGNSKTFRIVRDTTPPIINNVSLLKGIKVPETENDYKYDPAYFSNSKYFINNETEGNKLKVSGVSTDKVGLDTVTLKIQNTATENPKSDITNIPMTGDTGVWEFNGIDLSEWKTGARATITVTDLAGNPSEYPIDINFDIATPHSICEIDADNKNLNFRIGNNDNDDNESITTESAVGKWDPKLDKGVGGKYGNGTFGNATTIQIRGNFTDDEGSGVAMIYYKVYPNEQSYTNEEDLETLKNEVLTSYNGYFAPLATPETRRVFYNVGKKKNEDGGIIVPNEPDTTQVYPNSTQFTTEPNNKGFYKYFKNVENNFNETMTGFHEGNNYLVIVAVDHVGNSAVDEATVLIDGNPTRCINYTLNVDTTPPSDITTRSASGIIYTNGTNIPSLWGTVSDKSSYVSAGIDSLVLSRDGTTETVKTTILDITQENLETLITGEDAEDKINSLLSEASADSTLKIWKAADISDLIPEVAENEIRTISISATAKDKAGEGNTAPGVVATITIDKKAPTINIAQDSPTDADTSDDTIQVNGKITISGTSDDENGIEELVGLYYQLYTGNTVPSAPAANTNIAPGGTDNWYPVNYGIKSGSINWKFTGIDTKKLNGTDQIADNTKVCFTAAVKDKAGNIGYSAPRAVVVDQDTDRPVIIFSNVSLAEVPQTSSKMSADNRVSFSNVELYGRITDDDGIPKTLTYYYGIGTPSNNDFVNTNISYSNGSFTLKFKRADNKNDDGPHNLYFKVTDAANNVFTSQDTTTYVGTMPKIIDSSEEEGAPKYGYRLPDNKTTTTVTYLRVDTLEPYRGNLQFSTDDGLTWQDKSNIGARPFGGNTRKSFKVRIPAFDDNDVKSVKMEIKTSTESQTPEMTIDFTEGDTISNEDHSYNESYPNAKYWNADITIPDDMESSSKACTIRVSDGIKENPYDFTIIVDNTAPVISVVSPSSSQYSCGNITAVGETDLTYWKNTATGDEPREFMYYAISLDDSTTPAVDFESRSSATAITSWKDENDSTGSTSCNYKPYYSVIQGGSFNWYVYFDGGSTSPGESHDTTFKQFLIDSGITTEAAISSKQFTTKVKAYIWVKAVDQVGLETVIKHPILIDPQGDAPTITIDYPEKSGTTLGGTVSLRGTALDTIGTVIGVDSVWVQIISAKENGYDSSTVVESGEQTCGGLKFTDTVSANSHTYELKAFAPKLKDVKQWISNGYKVYTNITDETPTEVTTNPSGEDTADGSAYYIKANFSGSAWNIKINEHGEFNPGDGKLNPIAYRVFAKDMDRNLSNYEQRLSVYDSDNPIISDLYLRQYQNEDGTGDITASRPFEDDMWVKGTWWLCGKVKDTQGLSSLKIGPVGSLQPVTITGEVNAEEDFKYKLSTGSDFGSLTIGIEASDNASPVHTITRDCVINYDNTKPELVTEGSNYNINNSVQNSNGFYSFGSMVKEDPVGNKAQSGFDYLAFWFERELTGTNSKHVVFDVMRAKANSEIPWNDLEVETNSGLKWKSKTVGRSEESLETLTLTQADANIHVGGLCKIGGSIYFITSISADGKTINIKGQPEYTGESQTALFAIANVVNNTIESGTGTKSTADGSYGYFGFVNNDDGDHMIESVRKSGTSWIWEANINSQNMSDGKITLHYVAFDKAGNYAEGSIEGSVTNNAPRLASLEVWSDFNENNTKDKGESETRYYLGKERKIGGVTYTKATALTSELVVSGNDKDYVLAAGEDTYGSAFMTVKATTRFIPEIVGGNNALYYSYKYGTKDNLASAAVTYAASSFGTGNDDGIDEEKDSNGYYKLDDQQENAYISGHSYFDADNHYMEIPGAGDPGTYSLNGIGNSSPENGPTWFEYTIYDSTEGCSDWNSTSAGTNGRLYAKFRVALNIKYQDTEAPKVKIRPFYWNSLTDNSVYSSQETISSFENLEGHIELEKDLTPAVKTALGEDDPKVSGKIKVEGYAFDDIKIKELYVKFDNHTQLNTEKLASTYTGTWSKRNFVDGWGFEAEDIFCNGDGHLVHWTLILDTAVRETVAQKDQVLVVYAKDARADNESLHNGTVQTTLEPDIWGNVKTEPDAANLYFTDIYCLTKVTEATPDTAPVYKDTMKPYYKMDVVPYVTTIETSLGNLKSNNPSVYSRTASGHYAVASDETITINGFNLAGSKVLFTKGTGTVAVNYGNGEINIPEAATSGELKIAFTNAEDEILIASLNNINNNDGKGSYGETVNLTETPTGNKTKYNNYYNRQPNGDNNNLLTDDVILDVWEIDPMAVQPKKGSISQPVMAINPVNHDIGFAFVNGALSFSMPNSGYSYDYSIGGIDYWTSIGLAYDTLGNSYATTAGGDINATSADQFRLMTSRWGRGVLTRDGYNKANNQLRLELIGQINFEGTDAESFYAYNDFDKERIQSPSIVTTSASSTETTVYMAYYDNINNEIRFKWGKIKATKDKTWKNLTATQKTESLLGDYYGAGSEVNAKELRHDDSGRIRDYGIYHLNHNSLIAGQTKNKLHATESEYEVTVYNAKGEPTKYEYIKVDDEGNPKTPNTISKAVLDNNNQPVFAGKYVSITAIENGGTEDDAIIAVWYDQTNNKLMYSYNKTPKSITVGEYLYADTGWSNPVEIFGNGIGEYCKVTIDKINHVHIAAYDSLNGDLCYAYIPEFDSPETKATCIVDSYGIIGTEINIDVVLDSNNNPVPYISYYAGSCVKPKMAYWAGKTALSITALNAASGKGAVNEVFTGSWEVTIIPTSSIVSNDHVNIGTWKDSNGKLTWSTTDGENPAEGGTIGVNSFLPGAGSTDQSYGMVYGNGSKNPVLGYAITKGSNGYIETAQKK